MSEFERQLREPRIAALREITNAAMFEELQHLRILNVEFFDALVECEKYLVERGIENSGVTGRTIVLPKIRAAIAKARGE